MEPSYQIIERRDDGKLVVDLTEYFLRGQSAVLVVPHATGVIYLHQAGGVACLHPQLEAFAIPTQVPSEIAFGESTENANREHACWGGSRWPVSDSEQDWLEELFDTHWWCRYQLDRSRIAEAMEGWLPVTILPAGSETAAWLAHENCD